MTTESAAYQPTFTPLGDVALTPLDGRYRSAVAPLAEFLSEAALNRYRAHVEVEWLLQLAAREDMPAVREITDAEVTLLRTLITAYDSECVAAIAEIEATTRHDVKAVEYWLKDHIAGTSLEDLSEFVHLFCTSEDINNLSYALMVQAAVRQVWLPAAHAVVAAVEEMAVEHRDVPLLARTHGQAATPSTLGKELAVLAWRMRRQLKRIEATEFLGKINGATGTYGAHVISVPDADWQGISRTFVESLGLTWNPLTTQIESHDWQAELYADMARFNRVLHNLCTDVWTYISMGYFTQVLSGQGTVGSSTMPHKVNPIRFENAEANLEVSCALLDVLASTLVTSRLQRDLTDSSMQRNIGSAFGHSLLALENVRGGLGALAVAPDVLAADLDATWEVLGEAVQSVMRIHGLPEPYEQLKEFTRGRKIDAAALRDFILDLDLPEESRDRLLALTPGSYIGLASQLVDHLKD